jgi:hypothetical protein
MSGWGGAGRQGGSPNKVGQDLRDAAAQYPEEALATLALIMRDPEAPHPSRVAASTALLDRAHGRPAQSIQAKVETAAEFAVAMIPETATTESGSRRSRTSAVRSLIRATKTEHNLPL